MARKNGANISREVRADLKYRGVDAVRALLAGMANGSSGTDRGGIHFTSRRQEAAAPRRHGGLLTIGNDKQTEARRAIARGEQVFNTVPIKITGMAGLNDVTGKKKTVNGFCGTCHDTPDIGNHSVQLAVDIGVTGAGKNAPPVLETADLPVFNVLCTGGNLAGKTFKVTDLGRAMITGSARISARPRV